MNRVFGDTYFFIALLNRRESQHRRAVEFYSSQTFEQILTTAWVLTELADGMSGRSTRTKCSEFIRRLLQDRNTRVIPPDDRLFGRGFELFEERSDKEWSLTDCISFVVMKEEGLQEALTGDRHFQQAGFTALLL